MFSVLGFDCRKFHAISAGTLQDIWNDDIKKSNGGFHTGCSSWVPDFTLQTKARHYCIADNGSWYSSKRSEPIVSFYGKEMHVGAIFCDVVKRVSYLKLDSVDELGNFLKQKQSNMCCRADPDSTGQANDARNCLVPVDSIYRVAFKGFTMRVHPILRNKTSMLFALFSTRLGFAGLAFRDVRRADEVIVPFGASTPFIVRPRKSKSSSPANKHSKYTFVGDCLVDGVMQGELIDLYDQGLIEANTYTLV